MDQNPVLRQRSLFPQTRSQSRNRLIADSQEIQLRGHIQTAILQNFQSTPGGFRLQTSSQDSGVLRVNTCTQQIPACSKAGAKWKATFPAPIRTARNFLSRCSSNERPGTK